MTTAGLARRAALAAGLMLALVGAAPQGEEARRRGFEAAMRGDLEQAYELLAPWVQGHPDDREAASALAALAAQTGRPEEAEALLARFPADDP